jgi:hypothetical protein
VGGVVGGVTIIELQINNSHGALLETMDYVIFCLHYLAGYWTQGVLAGAGELGGDV